jgi:hypothetical protein
MQVRFLVQPTMAAILGIRAGIHDVRQATPPFIWSLCTRPEERKRQLKQALEHLLIPIVVAIVLDGIVQYLLFKWIRVLGAVILGTILMGLPYSVARGLTNRIISARRQRSTRHRAAERQPQNFSDRQDPAH